MELTLSNDHSLTWRRKKAWRLSFDCAGAEIPGSIGLAGVT
jgi:hypothetical protein